MQLQNHSCVTDIQLTSKHTSSHSSSTTSPRKRKRIKADPKVELSVWEQVSGFLAAAILANISLNICEMMTQQTRDTKPDQNKK